MDRDFSQAERDLLKRSHQIATLKKCLAWIEEHNEFIKQLETAIMSSIHGSPLDTDNL